MRIAITGASGNVGTSLIDALRDEPEVDSIVCLARRAPDRELTRTEWVEADVATDDLVVPLRGADVVVHLAWQIQPSRDEAQLWRVNVEGSARVFEAAARAGAGAVVYASSVGAYSPGPSDTPVAESWPTHGIPTSSYSRQKAYVERVLDLFEAANPGMRVVRLRPALIFKGASGPEVRRYFMGPFVPGSLLHPRFIPVVPDVPGLRFQAVHADDVAEAYRLAVISDVQGAFNIAADPVLGPRELGEALGARPVPLPSRPLRAAAGLTWRLRLQPTEPGWLDLAVASPLLDTTRARTTLGWTPTRSAVDALHDLLAGMRDGGGGGTPVLHGDDGAAGRADELATGVGARN